MCIFKRCVENSDEEKAEEIRKCKESPAYFFNKYCVLYDKNGNEIEKPFLTDEDIQIVFEVKKFVDAYDFKNLTPQTSNKIQV